MGIPYALVSGVNIYLAFIVCFISNVLAFPLMNFFLDSVNKTFLKWRFYKRSSIYVARKAKRGAGKNIDKYGFWGLMLFVLVPVPGTGVYAGTIAAYLFRIDRKKAFLANTLGIFISCLIVWFATILTMKGIQ